MSVAVVLLVAAMASAGAVARYLVDTAVSVRRRGVFPWGTFVVNTTGSFLLGLLTGLAIAGVLGEGVTTVLSAGFTGGYTTWSTWTFETVRLAEDGAWLEATLNVAGSLLAGLIAAAGGLGLGILAT